MPAWNTRVDLYRPVTILEAGYSFDCWSGFSLFTTHPEKATDC